MGYAHLTEQHLNHAIVRLLSHHTFRVWVYLNAHLQGRNNGWRLGAKETAAQIGLSVRTYYRSCAELEAAGLILRKRATGRSRGWSTYHLISPTDVQVIRLQNGITVELSGCPDEFRDLDGIKGPDPDIRSIARQVAADGPPSPGECIDRVGPLIDGPWTAHECGNL